MAAHPYPGNRPDVSVFTETLDALTASCHAITGSGDGETVGSEGLTVVFDARQNSAWNFAHLIDAGARYVGSSPRSDHQDLLAVPKTSFASVAGFDGLTAHEAAKHVGGRPQRIVMIHSQTLHEAQSRGFDQTLGKTTARLDDLAATLARGKTRRSKEALNEQTKSIIHNTWVTDVLTVTVTVESPKDFRLTHKTSTASRMARRSGSSANAS